jgi:hypothetical protein
MEELARASLLIRDLAKGIEGTVLIETSAYDECSPPSDELKEEMRLCLEEIHQGQRDMHALGWHRAPDFLIERMWVPNHHQDRAAWFKDDHERRETKWITACFTFGFGFRALFTNEPDPGARMVGTDEMLHRREHAETACVFVFTTNADGEQDEVVAEFYPLKDETHLDQAEERAISFLNILEPKVQR